MRHRERNGSLRAAPFMTRPLTKTSGPMIFLDSADRLTFQARRRTSEIGQAAGPTRGPLSFRAAAPNKPQLADILGFKWCH